MKSCLLLLSAIVLAVAARADTIVFDTLGPTSTYDPVVGNSVQNPFGYMSLGGRFVAESGGFLTTVELALTYIQNAAPGTVDVFLYGDLAGQPDNGNQTYLGSATPTAYFGSTNSSLVSFAATGNVSIAEGGIYWLVLRITTPSAATVWNIAGPPAIFGGVAYSMDNTTWLVNTTGTPAFRLSATAVPEPDAVFLLGSGGALLALAFGARKVKRRSSLASAAHPAARAS